MSVTDSPSGRLLLQCSKVEFDLLLLSNEKNNVLRLSLAGSHRYRHQVWTHVDLNLQSHVFFSFLSGPMVPSVSLGSLRLKLLPY